MEVAGRHQDQLSRIKENVKKSYESFRPNYDRFNEFRRFIFETSLSSDDISLLNSLSKPQLEFNICEAYISRLMGEFSKQEPAISVTSEDESQADPTTIHVVEQHIRHVIMDSKNSHVRWELMKEIYSGGFSVGKVYTDYANEMSFDHVLRFEKAFDPCLCGFDQIARQANKGDGRFCFELMPYQVDEFKKEHPDVRTEGMSFNRSFSSFNWSYLNGNEKIVLVCDYYEKKKREVKIVQLADGKVMKWKEYEAMVEAWQDIIPPPEIKGKPRWTTLEKIVRYRCVETEVIEYKETDYDYFPLVFFDGNSIVLKNPKTSGAVQQVTRPYVYHAKGAQQLKNFAGISLANSIENIVQHKFIVAKEALPKEEDWLAAYKDVQKPNVLVHNAFFEQDPDKPILNGIREVQNVPAPPEVIAAFTGSDSLVQNILGSYDASLGINDNQLSGVAIVEGATQSNAAAMPYIVGFLQGLQRVAELLVSLIPKYYKTPRTIPILGIDGKPSYVKVNQDQGISMFYDTNVLNVRVEAGVSFQIQKSKALQQLIALQQASPLFAQFMNEKGLPVLLDNIEIKGIDQLKLMVEDWLKELAQQKQMAMQQQQQEMQNNPAVMKNNIEMQKLQQKQMESQVKAKISQDQLSIDMAKLHQDQMKILSDIEISKDNNITQRMKAETERFARQVDLALKRRELTHKHFREAIETHHKVHKENRESLRPHKEASR